MVAAIMGGQPARGDVIYTLGPCLHLRNDYCML